MQRMNNLISAFREVFSDWKQWIILVTLFLVVALFQIWLTSYTIIHFVFTSSILSWRDNISILGSSVIAFFEEITMLTQAGVLLMALLIGLNLTLLIFYFKRHFKTQGAAGVSVFGMVLGVLGVGCISCGPVVFTSILGLALSTNLLTFLPLRGGEFTIIAMCLLLISTYLIAQKISRPFSCKL